ncbi:MAG TPA: VOC family protein [Vicinamibacteria bacterium]|nr:VOC family protein [Vicinamibacteria bacterium]
MARPNPVALALALAAAATAAAAERPPIVGVSHIAFQVSDLARARAFYADLLGYEELYRAGEAARPSRVGFLISGRQYVEIVPGLAAGRDERLDHVAFETTDLASMRTYLEGKGVEVAEATGDAAGDRVLRVKDPDGHPVEFVQHVSRARVEKAGAPNARRIAARLLHVGLTVADVAAADRFYKDLLGFSEIWRGGRSEAETDWINMKVPDGTDYLEYMLVRGPVDRDRLGSLHHMALLVPDIQAALETVRARPGGRDARTVRTPQVGRNKRWQLNLFDPDGSRTELMEPFTMR